MGQVNCQCQEVIIEDLELNTTPSKYTKLLLPQFDRSDRSEMKHLLTRVTLKNSKKSQYLCLRENESLVVGTSQDCEHRWTGIQGSSFKMTMKITQRALMVRDLGLGLGVFVVRKMMNIKVNNEEFLLSIDDNFLLIRLTEKKIFLTVFDGDSQKIYQSDPSQDFEFKIRETKLTLHRQKSSLSYTLRRHDRKLLCLLLSSQQRIKMHEVLRLGSEYFTVQGIFTCVDTARVLVEQ